MKSAFKRCDYNNKKWMIDTTVTFSDGTTRHFKRRGYSSKASAQADFERAKAEFIKKSGFATNDSFSDLVIFYLEYQSNKLKATTIINKKNIFDIYISPFFSDLKITNSFNLNKLNEFRKQLSQLELSTDRKNKILAELRFLGDFAYKRELIPEQLNKRILLACEPFMRGVEPPSKHIVWSKAQYKKFINTFDKNDKYKVYFQFMFYSGCRFGESLAVLWKDLNIEEQTIAIYKSATNKLSTGQTEITTPKTTASIRKVYLNKNMMEQILLLKKAYGDDPNSYMFFGTPNPMGRSTIRWKFNHHIKKADLPKITIHEIRHTNNTWLLSQYNSNIDADIITKRLGRSSLKVTLDTYFHTNQEQEKKLMDNFTID